MVMINYISYALVVKKFSFQKLKTKRDNNGGTTKLNLPLFEDYNK